MNRAIFTWLISAGSLVAFLLISPPADAIPLVSQNVSLLVSASNQVYLNNPTQELSSIKRQNSPSLEQFGCSCAACQKALSQMQGQIVL
ncbi:MAG: hypothetical protein WA919_24220 [Coleofasciculaceae cyanobacterium]